MELFYNYVLFHWRFFSLNVWVYITERSFSVWRRFWSMKAVLDGKWHFLPCYFPLQSRSSLFTLITNAGFLRTQRTPMHIFKKQRAAPPKWKVYIYPLLSMHSILGIDDIQLRYGKSLHRKYELTLSAFSGKLCSSIWQCHGMSDLFMRLTKYPAYTCNFYAFKIENTLNLCINS